MNHRSPVRMLRLAVAAAATVALAGCYAETLTRSNLRAQQPLSPKMVAELERKNMAKESPILIRIFKEEAELEVWKEDRSGRFALLKTYPICRWSGELGPKLREGDRQAPEGFYTVTPAQMNPNSSYYLAFNLGYPNAYDRAWGRTGSELMVHGDCSSRGCYAMTDEQMGEIYALARESFFGGQRAFQVQAFPFRMTPVNLAKHRANPNMAFWRMLKEGYDHFEVTRLEPKVDVCERRYVFNAEAPTGGALAFSPTGACPAYQVPATILAAVRDKQRRDEERVAELVSRGTPTAPIKTGADGGMNPVFLAALNARDTGGAAVDNDGRMLAPAAVSVPGTIPAHVVPPRATRPVPAPSASETQGAAFAAYSAAPEPAQAVPGPAAAAGTATEGLGGALLRQVGRLVGYGDQTQTAAAETPLPPARARRAAAPRETAPRASSAARPAVPHARPAVATAEPALRGSTAAPAGAADGVALAAAPAPSNAGSSRPAPANAVVAPTNTIVGAYRVLPAGSFESRWSGLR